MKKLTRLLAPLLFITTFTYGQEFCGHIKYQYRYFSTKNNKEVTSKVDEIKTEDFYVCGDKFKIYFDGVLKDIFIGDSLVYFHVNSDSTIGYIKADKGYGQKLPKYTNPKISIQYNDKAYNTIDENSGNDQITYYFNEEIKIDPLTFDKLELYDWNKFFKATNGGIRLVSITRSKKMTTICEATEINRIELADKDFQPTTGYEIKPFDFFKVKN
jgi:hypothetical protein